MNFFSKTFIVILIFTIVFTLISCKNKETATNLNEKIVAVSIIPEETFVNKVSGELIKTVVMIPPGASPANYQIKPKEMEKLSNAQIYFSIGVSAEKNSILPKLNDINPKIKIIDLADKVSDIYPDIEFSEGKRDPHVWISPKRVIIMIEAICEELIKISPENKEKYIKNKDEYIKKLELLDNDIKDTLSNVKDKSFIIYHPAFGYFAKDYNLTMISIEEEGKEKNIKNIKKIIDFAKENDIKSVFYQGEIDGKKVKVLANEIDGEAIELRPLSKDYITNMYKSAESLKRVMEYEQ